MLHCNIMSSTVTQKWHHYYTRKCWTLNNFRILPSTELIQLPEVSQLQLKCRQTPLNNSVQPRPYTQKCVARKRDLYVNLEKLHTLCGRDLRIVFFLVRIESRIESAVYTTQAVTQPEGLQAYRTGL